MLHWGRSQLNPVHLSDNIFITLIYHRHHERFEAQGVLVMLQTWFLNSQKMGYQMVKTGRQ